MSDQPPASALNENCQPINQTRARKDFQRIPPRISSMVLTPADLNVDLPVSSLAQNSHSSLPVGLTQRAQSQETLFTNPSAQMTAAQSESSLAEPNEKLECKRASCTNSPNVASNEPPTEAQDVSSFPNTANPSPNVTLDQEGFIRGCWFSWRSLCYAQICLSILILALGGFVLDKTGGTTCFSYMKRWLIGQMCISGCQLAGSVLLLIFIPSIYDTIPTAMQRSYKCAIPFALTRIITAGFIIWQMVGISSLGIGADSRCGIEQVADTDWIYVVSYFILLTQCIFLLSYASLWLCLPCGFMLYYAYAEAGEDEVSFFTMSNRHGAPQTMIDALPQRQYALDMQATSTCAICLNDFMVRDPLKVLPCEHYFHAACIGTWLSRNAICPQCRRAVVSDASLQV